ncbi:DMT family transporter [Isobaculum melis]|uniref:Paired small multidrug resistance pump n=1 Tax=Isobaculum melis TaxID=142588 RepID=A0A1H9TN45_9LACT|nr:SMR family transporter [Isobaculum melis]SER98043.1 paired small multidrug resistance pump [Isobaculum melis]
MTKHWLMLIVGAFFEVLWVTGMKHSTSWLEVLLTLVAIIISFYALIRASEALPVGTAYAVFVGLGTTGTIIVSSLLFGESFSLVKGLLLAILLAGVLGLKIITGKKG